uniref:SET domain-containing protein n=1 Tax=Macrostomum lignano TaxID=282301 RepID=A0A1I8H712_9PLAT
MEQQLELSDLDQATVTSSSSQLETVQPFTIEDSPPLEPGSTLLQPDSGTMMCASPRHRSPSAVAIATLQSSKKKSKRHKAKGWAESNQLSHNRASVHAASSDDRGTYSFSSTSSSTSSSASALEPDSLSSTSIGRKPASSAEDAAVAEPETEGVEEDSAPAMRSTDEENDTSATEGPSTDGGMEGDSSEFGVGEQTDSVFTNLGETSDAEAASLTEGNAEKPATQRQSLRLNKNEIANLIEKAILDFCSSRTVETMRRMFAGVTNDSDALLRDGGRHDDKSASTPHPVTGELVKEGVIIGDVDIFAPRMQREFILPVKDSLIEAFLKEPGVFRAICYRTRCQVEVTRRLLNRKLCIGGRWHKYMIIRIVGPTFKCIENCDTLLQKAVPSYKWRKTYHTAAVCRMYLREDVPDNAELYFGYQRTGGSSHRFGALKLESPYRQTATRTVGNSPWKFGLFKVGKLTFSAPAVKLCMKHVYPSLGYQTTSNLEPEYQGVNAVERITALHDQFQMGRQSALALKRALTIPVCR